jgi:hypothetical protein
MPYCPNCGSRVEDVHHYCGSCGNALSSTAEVEDDPPMAVDREGFLSMRSVSYITDLLNGEREVDRESVLHKQLQRDVAAGLADFSRLAVVDELNLVLLWAGGTDSGALEPPIEEITNQQLRQRLAALGLSRTLRMYDNALGTNFEDQLNEAIEGLVDEFEDTVDDAKKE